MNEGDLQFSTTNVNEQDKVGAIMTELYQQVEQMTEIERVYTELIREKDA